MKTLHFMLHLIFLMLEGKNVVSWHLKKLKQNVSWIFNAYNTVELPYNIISWDQTKTVIVVNVVIAEQNELFPTWCFSSLPKPSKG